MTGMSGMSLEQLELPGMSCKTHGCISRRSPCLLCVEFLELDCSTRRALCLLHVEFSVLCTCRIGAGIGAGIGAEESCKTSSCRIVVLEVSVKTVMPLLRMEHF